MTRPQAFAAPLPVLLRPIGFMRSPFAVHHEAPRQPRARSGTEAPFGGEIHIVQGLQNCLADLDGFSHLWVLFFCHHTRGWNSKVTPPRGQKKRGVFSTRAPARPNAIGLSCLELLGIDKRVLRVGDHDILDGTPILDLKPYLPYCDSVEGAKIGYAAALPTHAADHRAWWTEKGVEPPRVYRRRPGGPPGGAGPDRAP